MKRLSLFSLAAALLMSFAVVFVSCSDDDSDDSFGYKWESFDHDLDYTICWSPVTLNMVDFGKCSLGNITRAFDGDWDVEEEYVNGELQKNKLYDEISYKAGNNLTLEGVDGTDMSYKIEKESLGGNMFAVSTTGEVMFFVRSCSLELPTKWSDSSRLIVGLRVRKGNTTLRDVIITKKVDSDEVKWIEKAMPTNAVTRWADEYTFLFL